MTKFSIHMAARMSINMRSELTKALNLHIYASMVFMLDTGEGALLASVAFPLSFAQTEKEFWRLTS
jgi:hypothetical protein